MSGQSHSDNLPVKYEDVVKIKARIAEKEEILRQLKLVKSYKEKHSIESLAALKQRWKAICQELLPDLLFRLNEKNTTEIKLTMEGLLKHLDIQPEHVSYDADDECFE